MNGGVRDVGTFGTVMSGCVPITSALSRSVPCSMFCVYKREGFFLIYSQIILVMTQICNKSHQCYLDVFTLCVTVLGPPLSELDSASGTSTKII